MENYVSYTDTLLQTGLRPCVCAKIVTCLRLYTYESVFIKGLVHPKMKIKSLITHPHDVPTP